MFSRLKHHITQGRKIAAVGFGLAGLMVFASTQGWFESVELGVLDQFFRWRSSAAVAKDERILIVTIDEEDIASAGQWPISDQMLAELVLKIGAYEPASIGIDLYRNFPVEPGSEDLIEAFEATPMVIGAERVIGEAVPPHQTLAELEQVAAIDLVVDDDGRVRRGLLSVISPTGEVKQGLAATLALDFLSSLDIHPEVIEDDTERLSLQLGQSTITRFEKNDGGYVNADSGGYQILMNYRGGDDQFDTISMTDVLQGALTDEMVRDRIVLIGSIAVSLPDLFYTPLDREQQISGVFIHALLVSQLLNASLDNQSLLKTVPTYMEWLWAAFWTVLTILASRSILYSRALKAARPTWQVFVRLGVLSGGLGATGYGLFWAGWWLPVTLPLLSMTSAVTFGFGYRNQQLQNLAAYDELTQVANRRYFDQYLLQTLKSNKELSLILCDVDYFKSFNDLYGHPAGDRCLYHVANALKQAVRDADMVARYGGEEFVIVLPDTDAAGASKVAQRIQTQIRKIEITHEGSQVSPYVTLSGGLVTMAKDTFWEPTVLVEYADKALYEAKESGRNRVVVSNWNLDKDLDTTLDETT